MNETAWPCNVVFDVPFGKSHCTSCGRQWEAMTPKGSERHCVRELGTRLAAAEARIRAFEMIEREFHSIDDIARIRDLEGALQTLRPFIENITLRAVIDEVLPPQKGAPAVP